MAWETDLLPHFLLVLHRHILTHLQSHLQTWLHVTSTAQGINTTSSDLTQTDSAGQSVEVVGLVISSFDGLYTGNLSSCRSTVLKSWHDGMERRIPQGTLQYMNLFQRYALTGESSYPHATIIPSIFRGVVWQYRNSVTFGRLLERSYGLRTDLL